MAGKSKLQQMIEAQDMLLAVTDPKGMLPHMLALHAKRSGVTPSRVVHRLRRKRVNKPPKKK